MKYAIARYSQKSQTFRFLADHSNGAGETVGLKLFDSETEAQMEADARSTDSAIKGYAIGWFVIPMDVSHAPAFIPSPEAQGQGPQIDVVILDMDPTDDDAD
jgi:hypothetical protein